MCVEPAFSFILNPSGLSFITLDDKLNVFSKNWESLPYATRDKIGKTVDYASGRNRYIGYLISLGMYSFNVSHGGRCSNVQHIRVRAGSGKSGNKRYSLACVRGVVPSDSIYKNSGVITKKR